MYDELVMNLRDLSNWSDIAWREYAESGKQLIKQAADAIEELAAFKAQITDGHFYCMRDGVLYEAKVEMPKGKIVNLPPIEFKEES